MKVKVRVNNPRINEITGILAILLSSGLLLSLVSYSPYDPSVNLATTEVQTSNWMGVPGAYIADFFLQTIGLSAFIVPFLLAAIGWSRIRIALRRELWKQVLGGILLILVICSFFELLRDQVFVLLPSAWEQLIKPGGATGQVLTSIVITKLNLGGTILLMITLTVISFYLLSSQQLAHLFNIRSGSDDKDEPNEKEVVTKGDDSLEPVHIAPVIGFGENDDDSTEAGGEIDEAEEKLPPIVVRKTKDDASPAKAANEIKKTAAAARKINYKLPDINLLHPLYRKESYDKTQLQEIARHIVERFDEFGVRGSINQINPGPVVTTFELKPDRGMKYSKIVSLSEDLCLTLECESILVERLPGKSTVGIEVPNKNREIIALKEIIESATFKTSTSMLTFALGKDISGRIHVADLSSMPHLLVAGSTGSGKSVMVNSIIMSILLRSTPEDVRFIMIDPKTVELGLYSNIPHLLTPVITDMKKAANALKNATLEMERRLQLLAQFGVRNISQFNKKLNQMKQSKERGVAESIEDIERLPYIIVIVDELADMMIMAGRQVEESITRLAQMSRAVGIHLLLATQRPSVNVITGLIKANIPARLSFRLATGIDSRTIIDSNGAESLLGHGDMLFLPPGTSRRRRLHGPLVSEDEIEAVVAHWASQSEPDYEESYLNAPNDEGEQGAGSPDQAGLNDSRYREAVELVFQMGKASTSILQRRLSLGYGRAARILDAMEQERIVGPSVGSRPRQVLKKPDWLEETVEQATPQAE